MRCGSTEHSKDDHTTCRDDGNRVVGAGEVGVVRDWPERDAVMFKRLSIASVAALLAGLIIAASGVAATATSQDGVFRYRASPGENVFVESFSGGPKRFLAVTRVAPSVGPGCNVRPHGTGSPHPSSPFEVVCELAASETERQLRYRFSLSDGDDFVEVADPLHGVVYGGPGRDDVGGYTARVFGGLGRCG
jgi:hypothetical protein